jgi:hypothetical protein
MSGYYRERQYHPQDAAPAGLLNLTPLKLITVRGLRGSSRVDKSDRRFMLYCCIA